jgi:gamma-glutamyltranspeptidase/glutathione hydrolase
VGLITRYAPTGMVSSIDHLASTAGVAVLQAGGTAADAAVATSAVLAVTSPHLCGMGGDLLALVHDGPGPPAVLNASGRAGSGADPARLRADGHVVMPFTDDIRSVTVPGCVDGWLELLSRFGRLPVADVLGPAIGYARDGFPVAPLLSAMLPLVLAADGARDYRPEGRKLRTGERCRRPGAARALEAVVAGGRAGFYQGEFGAGLLALGAGEYQPGDLARSQADWVEPLGRRVWGHEVWTVPPNSQGYLMLAAALIAEGLDIPADPDDPRWVHLLVESAKQAGFDRPARLFDGADADELLDPEMLDARRAGIDPDRAAVRPSPGAAGGTIYLCAVDGAGRGVSLIQSNASGFGSHLFEPFTGINLHNRGLGFSLEPGHPAEYGAGRRPPHTLSPALVTRPDGSLRAVLGSMGGDAQPQIVLQLLARLLHADQRPGEIVGSPRFVLANGAGEHGFDTWAAAPGASIETVVELEADAPPSWAAGLEQRGHTVRIVPASDHAMGHAHLIEVRADSGGPAVLAGSSDPREPNGAAVGY